MWYGMMLLIHVLVSLVLIGIILVQGGRGGMAETLGGSAMQSLFGGGANLIMTKVTAAGAAIFMVTCVTLAILSTHKGRSVIEQMPITAPAPVPASAQELFPPATPEPTPSSSSERSAPSSPSTDTSTSPEPPTAPAQ